MAYDQLKLSNQLCFRFYTVSRLITQAYHPFLTRIGLTYPQYLVMMALWEKDAQPVNDIAKTLVLETNTITPLLKRMEENGLISRSRGKKDGRQVIVTLTEKGRLLEEEAKQVPFEIGSAVACRSLSPEKAPELFQTLDDIIVRLETE